MDLLIRIDGKRKNVRIEYNDTFLDLKKKLVAPQKLDEFDIFVNAVEMKDNLQVKNIVTNPGEDKIDLVPRTPAEEPNKENESIKKLQSFAVKATSEIQSKSTQASTNFMQKLNQKAKSQSLISQQAPKKSINKLSTFFFTAPNHVLEKSKTQSKTLMEKILSARSQTERKGEENPSLIHQEEPQEIQNETVINILDDMRVKRFQIPKINSGIIKNPLPQKQHQPSPEARSYKERFDKAKKLTRDPEASIKAQLLVKELDLKRRELQIKRQEQFLHQSRLLNESIEIHKRQMEGISESTKEKKKIEIQQRLEEEKQRRFLRRQINKESDNIVKALKKEAEEEKFIKQKMLEEIEQQAALKRKVILEKKRELFKPISLKELREHRKKHDENIFQLKLEKEREKLEQEIENDRVNMKIQRSKFTTVIEEEEKQKKQALEKQRQLKQQQLQRKIKYGEIVNDMFKPKIRDASKEMEEQKKEIDLSTQNYVDIEDFIKIRQQVGHMKRQSHSLNKLQTNQLQQLKFKGYLQSEENIKKIKKVLDKSVQKISPKNDNRSFQDLEIMKQDTARKPIKKVPQLPDVSKISSTNKEPIQKQIDYLKQLRKQREEKEPQLAHMDQQWKRTFTQKNSKTTLDPIAQYQTAMTSIGQIEIKAKRKEQMSEDDEADQLYINSIKAKLELLEMMKNN